MAEDCCCTQLINRDGEFNAEGLDHFLKTTSFLRTGISYVVVAIMGPQSSGKSTLMNHLFGTRFVEMDASVIRGQTTQGIWIAKCATAERFTIAMDLEGTDGQERGQDDTTFEKRSSLFALAVSDIILINMWCKDIGRENAANRPLLKAVFLAMMQLFSPRKTTLMFVIRDTTKKTPFDKLKESVIGDIHKIWDAVPKPQEKKDTPLEEYFNVTALSNYEYEEEEFKEEVSQLKRHIFRSVPLGGLVGDRPGVVPASGFSLSVQGIWENIKNNRDLNLPALKVMVSRFRCGDIAKEKFNHLIVNKEWKSLKENVDNGTIEGFREKLNSILGRYLSEYDKEVSYYDVGERDAKRNKFLSDVLNSASPIYDKILWSLYNKELGDFKYTLESSVKKLKISAKEIEGFENILSRCAKNCMLKFNNGCEDAFVSQAQWDPSKVREELLCDMGKYAQSLVKELIAEYEEAKRKKIYKRILKGFAFLGNVVLGILGITLGG